MVTKKSFWKKENKLFNKGDIEEKLRSLLKGVYHKEKIDYLRRKSSGYNSEGTTSRCNSFSSGAKDIKGENYIF